jgi:hypothetical protein
MTGDAFLFLFSLLMVIGSIGAAGWLIAGGQLGIDEIFLLAVCLAAAFSFALYLKFLIGKYR